MDTARDYNGPPRTPREELQKAADHIADAADDAAESLMPHTLRHHLRSAVRHVFQAGVAAIDSADRRARRNQ